MKVPRCMGGCRVQGSSGGSKEGATLFTPRRTPTASSSLRCAAWHGLVHCKGSDSSEPSVHCSTLGYSAGYGSMKSSVLIPLPMQMLFLAFRAMFVALFTFPRSVSVICCPP